MTGLLSTEPGPFLNPVEVRAYLYFNKKCYHMYASPGLLSIHYDVGYHTLRLRDGK